ncbi:MAG: hypothetical protein F6K42_09085 [Leptolyngbya sp. SIO1D8]|nr:hypothetical protein [Leptolyngbya sp. SIO1D8]
MDLLNTFLSVPNTESNSESDFFDGSLTEVAEMADVEPLWKNIEETEAIVIEAISPETLGRVKFQGTRWRAWSDRPLTVGTEVRVIGRQRSNILIVEPVYAVA